MNVPLAICHGASEPLLKLYLTSETLSKQPCHNAPFCFAWLLLFDPWQLFWPWKFRFRSAVHKKFRWWCKFFSGNTSTTRKWDSKLDLNSLLNQILWIYYIVGYRQIWIHILMQTSFFLNSKVFDSCSQKNQSKLLLNPILIKVYRAK